MLSETNLADQRTDQSDHSDIRQFANAVSDPDVETPLWAIDFEGNNAPKRFSVYRNNVALSLREALQSTYPGIFHMVGEDNFNILASIYFSHYPPASPMMQYYGCNFPEFLKTFEPLSHSPFLVDLAQAEKNWIDSYHAIDEPVLDPARLGDLGEELLMGVCFIPHPAAFLVQSEYRLGNLFSSRNGEEIRGVDVGPTGELEGILITRPGLEVLEEGLDRGQCLFFSGILEGSSLGTAIETAYQTDGDFDATAAITKLLSSGAVSDMKIETGEDAT